MHSRIFIIGFMGAGKTTHGKKIARMMNYEFIDMDDWIVSKEGKSIPDIFTLKGEDYFRRLEQDSIKEISAKENVVVATGGGAPCNDDNLELMKKSGLVVYLKLTPAAILSRLTSSSGSRPLLVGKTEDELKDYIEETLQKREFYYNQAHMVIDGLDRVNERVVNAIQRKQG